jgi:hypothetical protein
MLGDAVTQLTHFTPIPLERARTHACAYAHRGSYAKCVTVRHLRHPDHAAQLRPMQPAAMPHKQEDRGYE